MTPSGGRAGIGVGAVLMPQPHASISPALKARDHKGVSSDGDGDGDGAILVPVAFNYKETNVGYGMTPTLGCGGGGGMGDGMSVMQAMQVRRLTPTECERLQGFPDQYTAITVRGKPAADGPRYKALGNSMAVPVMAWIGKRIQMVEELKGMA